MLDSCLKAYKVPNNNKNNGENKMGLRITIQFFFFCFPQNSNHRRKKKTSRVN